MEDALVVPPSDVEVVTGDSCGAGGVVGGENSTLFPFFFSHFFLLQYAFVGFSCSIQILSASHLKVWAMYVLGMMRVSPFESNT
jgi:hypothetical protein